MKVTVGKKKLPRVNPHDYLMVAGVKLKVIAVFKSSDGRIVYETAQAEKLIFIEETDVGLVKANAQPFRGGNK